MQTIFTVTTVRLTNDTRCVGWFSSFKEAQFHVVNNYGDINEAEHWHYCVIEKIRGNTFYPCPPEKEWWYRWNRKEDKYKRSNKPDSFKNVVNFGIG